MGPDSCNKVSIAIEQVVIILVVKGGVFPFVKKKKKKKATSVKCNKAAVVSEAAARGDS